MNTSLSINLECPWCQKVLEKAPEQDYYSCFCNSKDSLFTFWAKLLPDGSYELFNLWKRLNSNKDFLLFQWKDNKWKVLYTVTSGIFPLLQDDFVLITEGSNYYAPQEAIQYLERIKNMLIFS